MHPSTFNHSWRGKRQGDSEQGLKKGRGQRQNQGKLEIFVAFNINLLHRLLIRHISQWEMHGALRPTDSEKKSQTNFQEK